MKTWFCLMESGQFISRKRLDPHYLYPGVMICYANFVNHSVIGDEFYTVLKVIPLNRCEEEDNYVTMHFENSEYSVIQAGWICCTFS